MDEEYRPGDIVYLRTEKGDISVKVLKVLSSIAMVVRTSHDNPDSAEYVNVDDLYRPRMVGFKPRFSMSRGKKPIRKLENLSKEEAEALKKDINSISITKRKFEAITIDSNRGLK